MTTLRPALKPRILLIEDDPERIEKFQAWLADSPFVLVCATSGGQAMGLINRGKGEGVAGICLDHDLNTAPKTEMDALTSGTQVVTAICTHIPKLVPILVHSMNTVQGERMYRRLGGAGFSATKIRMAVLTRERFAAWLHECEDNWAED